MMAIHSFLKAQKGDPDWVFTPDNYFEKEFKVIEASLIELSAGKTEKMVLRQIPSERELLAKHIKFDIRENSSLDLSIINDVPNKLQQVFIYDIHAREGSILNLGLFLKGGKLNKHIIQITLDEASTFNSYGHIINNIGGDCEVIVKIDHHGSYSSSNQYFSCEAGKDSQTVFQSTVNIPRNCLFTQVGIELSNLITEVGGKCHSIPQVYNRSDCAIVSSGTRTDMLEREQTYYLQTRGIPKSKAEAFLIGKHRDKILSVVPTIELRNELQQLFG